MKFIPPKSHIPYFIFLFFIILTTYSNSLNNEFMMDDYGLILQDTKIHNIKFLHYQFLPDKEISLNIENKGGASYYRPFAHILPMVGWLLFGNNVLGYHVMNLLLFYLCVIAIFYLINCLFSNKPLAMLTSLLYTVHPLNGLFINYITASVFALQMLALTGAFILFWKASEKKQHTLLITFSLVCYIIGLQCHETSFALPFYLTASILILKDKFQKRYAFILFPYFLFSFLYFILRLQFASLNNNLFNKIRDTDISLFQFAASNIKLFFYYLSKFFYFDGITIKFSMPPVVTDGILWVVLFFMVIALWGYRSHKNEKVKMWGGAMLLIGFTPAILGSAFELQYGFMFEPHWVFLPSLGMFILASFYLLKIQKWIGKGAFFLILSLITLNMIAFSRQMNKLWSDEVAYCRYWLKHSPQQKVAMFYLAAALAKNGNTEEAKNVYHRTLEEGFIDWQVYVNLGLIAQAEGDDEKALSYFNNAIKLFPRSAVINNNIGILHKNNSDHDKAKESFYKAIEYNPYLLEPRLNLALLFYQEENYLVAQKLYEENLALKPRDEESLKGLIKIYIKNSLKEEINIYVQHVLRNAHSTNFYITTATMLAENGYPKLSLPLFKKALSQDPNNTEIYIEFGKFWANMNRFDDAINIWQKALKLGGNKMLINNLIDKAKKLDSTIK